MTNRPIWSEKKDLQVTTSRREKAWLTAFFFTHIQRTLLAHIKRIWSYNRRFTIAECCYNHWKESSTRHTTRSLTKKQLTAKPLLVQIDDLSVLDSVAKHARQHPSYVERDNKKSYNHERRNVKAGMSHDPIFVRFIWFFSFYLLFFTYYVCSNFFNSLSILFCLLLFSFFFYFLLLLLLLLLSLSVWHEILKSITINFLSSLVFSFLSFITKLVYIYTNEDTRGRHLPAFFPQYLQTWRCYVTVFNRIDHNNYELDTSRWGWIKKHLWDKSEAKRS